MTMLSGSARIIDAYTRIINQYEKIIFDYDFEVKCLQSDVQTLTKENKELKFRLEGLDK